MKNKTIIVLPTYNAGIAVVKTILGIQKYAPYATIIVVDDNSPDQTALLIKKSFKTKKVHIVMRQKKSGRGSAIIQGFKEGLKDKKVMYFIEMDADLCHNPKYIPLLIKECQKFDAVFASKYLKKSRIIGLPLWRELISRLANFTIQRLLNIPASDLTNGFRCYKRNVLEKIDLDHIQSRGFITLTEIAFYIQRKGFLIGEIPITFTFYQMNKSNFNFSEVFHAITTIVRLRFKKNYEESI